MTNRDLNKSYPCKDSTNYHVGSKVTNTLDMESCSASFSLPHFVSALLLDESHRSRKKNFFFLYYFRSSRTPILDLDNFIWIHFWRMDRSFHILHRSAFRCAHRIPSIADIFPRRDFAVAFMHNHNPASRARRRKAAKTLIPHPAGAVPI